VGGVIWGKKQWVNDPAAEHDGDSAFFWARIDGEKSGFVVGGFLRAVERGERCCVRAQEPESATGFRAKTMGLAASYSVLEAS